MRAAAAASGSSQPDESAPLLASSSSRLHHSSERYDAVPQEEKTRVERSAEPKLLSSLPLSALWRSCCVFVTALLGFMLLSYIAHRYLLPSSRQVLKPPSDRRLYSYLTLSNGLPVLLISDPESPTAACAMSVGCGFYNDPASVPGLAHFTEHMLFMGSSRFPSEQAYFQYVSEQGGSANAFTKEEETNFYYRLQAAGLSGSLDIFAQFFISPAFAASHIAREMHAIDSEHRLRVMDDDRRRYEILALSSSPRSPLHHYGTGSFDTLNRSDIRDRLRDFHSQHYSANRMRLVVMGRESLPELALMVSPVFSAIPNTEVQPPVYASLPFPSSSSQPNESSYTGKIVFIEPVRDSHILSLYWQCASQQHRYLQSPSAHLSFLLSHKSEGTLQHQLKSRGWLKFLTAGDEVDASSFLLYHVRLGLTDSGLQHVDEIVTAVFDYLHLVRTQGVTAAVAQELIDSERLSFLYSSQPELGHFVSAIASRMQTREVEDLLLSPDRRRFDAKAVQAFASSLTADGLLMLFSSSNFSAADFADAAVEKYYQIPYRSFDIPQQAMDRWRSVLETGRQHGNLSEAGKRRADSFASLLLPHPAAPQPGLPAERWPFSLPPPNPFISHTFDLLPASETGSDADGQQEGVEALHLLRDDNATRVWWRPDISFDLPFAYFFLEIRSPLLLSTPKTQAQAQLFAALVTESFTSTGYQAQLAGYQWSVTAVPSALRLTVSGYAEQLPAVLSRLFMHLAAPTLDVDRFFMVKALLLSHRDNIFLSMQPYDHALYLAQLITEQHKFPDALITQHAELLTPASIHAFIPTLFSDCFFELFAYGDITASASLSHADFLISLLNSSGSQAEQAGKHRAAYHVYEVPPGRYLYQWWDRHNRNPNSAVYVSIFTSSYHAVRHSAALALLHLLIQPFCFDRLRSQLQLGYVVRCINTIHYNTVQSFDVIVQGAEHSPADMDEQVELMLIAFHDALADMSEPVFRTARQSAVLLHSAPPASMAAAASTDWSHIVGLDHHFNRSAMETAALRNLTHAELLSFYRAHILPNEGRRRVSVEVWGVGAAEEQLPPPLPAGVAAPTAVITEESRERVKDEWRVYERIPKGKKHRAAASAGGGRKREYIVDSIFKRSPTEAGAGGAGHAAGHWHQDDDF